MWNSQQRERSEPAPLLKAMLGSLTAPGEPSPSPGLRGEQAKPTSVTRPCGSGLSPLHGRLDRADAPFLRSNAEIFLNSGRSFARYTPAVPDDLLQRCTAGHLALHHQVTEQKRRLEEEHFFFFWCSLYYDNISLQFSAQFFGAIMLQVTNSNTANTVVSKTETRKGSSRSPTQSPPIVHLCCHLIWGKYPINQLPVSPADPLLFPAQSLVTVCGLLCF